jgi:hypothetical protein
MSLGSGSGGKDAYIIKDAHSKANYNMGDARFMAADSAEKPLLVVDGGLTMDPNAFRKTSPITHFTPAELGMNTAGTHFDQNGARGDFSDSTPSSMKDEPPIGAYPVTHDPETASPMDQGLYLHAEDEGMMNSLNNKIISTVSQYWGISLVGLGLLGLGYYLGHNRQA